MVAQCTARLGTSRPARAAAMMIAVLMLAPRATQAQDLVITNVRIIVGNGTVINQGSIVVRGGRIASVSAAAANVPGVQSVDGRGMTAMAGFIDGHRHVNTGPNEKVQMQQLLDAGYTTVLSGGGPAEGNLTLKDHIEKGVIKGPRIIPSGRINLGGDQTPDKARAEVRRLAALGIKFIGEQNLTPKPGPTPVELQRIPRRVCVVAGDNKVAPLLAGLRAGVVTDLVVDEITATGLLEAAQPPHQRRAGNRNRA